jgi:single-strand DNA-binding protein
MHRDLNKVLLVGEVGLGPEMRFTPDGRPVTVFAIGVSIPPSTVADDPLERVEWITVVARDELAEDCREELVAGGRAFVEGCLHTHGWTDATGERCVRTEVRAARVIPLDGVPSRTSQETHLRRGDQAPVARGWR